jgi:hypothetical protein
MPSDLEHSRERFTRAAVDFWSAVAARDTAAADAYSAESDGIVEHWKALGRLDILLLPLLDEGTEAVLYAAAAQLLRHDLFEERCLQILESLTQRPEGLIAPTARLLLMRHRR